MRPFIEPATELHLWCFALELTPADDVDARGNGWTDAFEAYSTLLAGSAEAWAGSVGPRVACMLGVRPRLDGGGTLWFHSTELFVEQGRGFLRPARTLFASVLERWPELHCHVDPLNPALVRLAAFVGFELGDVVTAGPQHRLFHPAVLRRSLCAPAPTAPRP